LAREGFLSLHEPKQGETKRFLTKAILLEGAIHIWKISIYVLPSLAQYP